MTGYESKKKAAQNKLVVTDLDGHVVRQARKKRTLDGLTDDAIYAAAEIAWRAGWAACRDAEYVGEEAEDEAWGYQGATVAQDIEAKLEENT